MRHSTIPNMAGLIYCGDNLDVLREYIPRESVDLIYLDPPFNSQRTYNLVYKGQRAQEEAFKDFWSWEEAAATFHKITTSGEISKAIVTLLKALHAALIDSDSDQLAYLTMMTPRLVALHRALRPTGSMYLHCDPTASHYLKVVLDAIFGVGRFQNEIIWKRTNVHNDAKKWSPVSDTILFYAKGEKFTWNSPRGVPNERYVREKYRHVEADGRRYRLSDMRSPSPRPNLMYEWRGHQPHRNGWAYSQETMAKLHAEGRIWYPDSKTKRPYLKRYLDQMKDTVLTNVWSDIDPLNSQAKERLGYPTQKPLVLLERILAASSNPGDLVLDPFCGCGTTVEAAERLGRRWVGIDIARKAVEVIEGRFQKVELAVPNIVWHPADKQSAEALAGRDKLGFEAWVLRKIRAARLRKKDRGIDGESRFKGSDGKIWNVVVSVKGGKHLPPTFTRDLRGTIEREKAIGVLVTLFEPGKEMKFEASHAGFLNESDAEGPIPRLQLVTVDRLFTDLPPIRCPGENVTEMPKPSVPPPPGVGDQLALELAPKARPSKPRVASTKPRKQPAKTYPKQIDYETLAVAENVRPAKKK